MSEPKKSRSILWFFELLFLILAFIFVYRRYSGEPSAVRSEKKTTAAVESLRQNESEPPNYYLQTAVVCIDIDEEALKPLLAKGVFSKYMDYLYCFAEFTPPAPKEVVFYWKYRGVTLAQQKAKVQSRKPVAWSRMNMSEDRTGIWQVDIRTADGYYLGSAEFVLR